MQLNKTTGYAIRILIYLSTIEGLATSQEMASKMNIPVKYITNITSKLREHGFIISQQGSSGGYRLAKPAKDIKLNHIISTMEQGIKIGNCSECDPKCCFYNKGQSCYVAKTYKKLEESIEAELKKVNIGILAESILMEKQI